jgi:hypothetical protein
MCDSFHPLKLSKFAKELDEGEYAYSWYEKAPDVEQESSVDGDASGAGLTSHLVRRYRVLEEQDDEIQAGLGSSGSPSRVPVTLATRSTPALSRCLDLTRINGVPPNASFGPTLRPIGVRFVRAWCPRKRTPAKRTVRGRCREGRGSRRTPYRKTLVRRVWTSSNAISAPELPMPTRGRE